MLAGLALAAAVLPLVDGREQGWPVWSWAASVRSVLVAGLALQHSSLARRGGTPLLDPNLLRVRTVTAGLVAQLTLWCGQASFFLILALYLQKGRGLSALQSGPVFTILASAYLADARGRPRTARAPPDGRRGRHLIARPRAAAGRRRDGADDHPARDDRAGERRPAAGRGGGRSPLHDATGRQLSRLAAVGLIFFDSLDSSYATAMELALVALIGLLAAVAALSRLIPEQRRDS